MLIINRDSVGALKDKIAESANMEEAVAMVKRMLDIKQKLLWRADAGICCGGDLGSIVSLLEYENIILEDTLAALQEGKLSEAIHLLEEYEHVLEKNYESCEPKYC